MVVLVGQGVVQSQHVNGSPGGLGVVQSQHVNGSPGGLGCCTEVAC